MPVVGLPDGREVEFPDGTPNDVMERAMRDFMGGQGKAQPAATPAADAPSALGAGFRSVARGALMGFGDEMRAGVQSALGRGTYAEELAKARAQEAADQSAQPVASVAGGLFGGVGSALAGGAALGAAGAARLLPNVLLRSGAGGAASGAVTGFGSGTDGLENRAAKAGTGALMGGAIGGGVGLAGAALGRAIAPVRPDLTPEAQALRDAARSHGIRLSAADETGSPTLRRVENALRQLPGSSAIARNFDQAQQQDFTAAMLRQSGADARAASPQVLNPARDRIGQVFDDLSARNTLGVSPATAQRLQGIEEGLDRLPHTAAEPMRAWLRDVHGKVAPDGTMPGTAYRALDSALGKAANRTGDGDLRHTLGELRDTLRSAMDESIGPEDAAAWAQARQQYASLKTTINAVGRAGEGAAQGLVSPLAVRDALTQGVGREGYALGRGGTMNELARIGQNVVRPPPDPGTAGMSHWMQTLSGASAIGGAVAGSSLGPLGIAAGVAAPYAIPATVQAFINSPVGRRWLTNQIAPGFNPGVAAAAASTAGAAERGRARE